MARKRRTAQDRQLDRLFRGEGFRKKLGLDMEEPSPVDGLKEGKEEGPPDAARGKSPRGSEVQKRRGSVDPEKPVPPLV